ncbi:MAG TPA: hypothetical protein DCF68_17690 [Cyanothece sp. UBA12306]|nr:hypothetical protein [Cyanothece sp. UBA12306]
MKNYLHQCQQVGLILTSSFALLNSGAVNANILVPPSPFKGLNGINFDAAGQLYVGSVAEQTLYNIDINTGQSQTFIGSPQGQGDDFIFTSTGEMLYTATISGEVRKFDPTTQTVSTIVSNLPGVNPIIQKDDGRVFVAQSLTTQGNGLYEIDPTGVQAPRFISNNPGFLNSFDFGPDGLLYSPIQFGGAIVKIDVDTGNTLPVASGLLSPTSAKFNSLGELFALDTAAGQVVKVDTNTGQTEVIVSLTPGLDTMAFSSSDLLYVTHTIDSSVYEINTNTKEVRNVIEGSGLTLPNGIAAFDNQLYVADTYSYRIINTDTGAIEQTIPYFAGQPQFPINTSVNNDHILASSWFDGSVQRLDRNTSSVLNTYGDFVAPFDAIELADGTILVADCGLGQVTHILNEQGDNRQAAASNLFCPTGLAVIDANHVLVTEFLANRLSIINLLTGEVEIIATDLSQPEGVAYHSNGIAVVAETGSQSLRAIDVNTGKSEILAANLPIGLTGVAGGPPPYSMTGVTLLDDTIYLAGDLDNSIRTFELSPNMFQSVPEKSSPWSLLALGIVGLGLTLKSRIWKS